MTASRTLVLMIDDLQWLDEPSFKVLAALQARLPINCPFLLVASHHGREALPARLDWDQQITLGRSMRCNPRACCRSWRVVIACISVPGCAADHRALRWRAALSPGDLSPGRHGSP